jgi:hypothetical protein
MRRTKGGSSGGWCETTRSAETNRAACAEREAGALAADGNGPVAGDELRSFMVAGSGPVPVSAGRGAQHVCPTLSEAQGRSAAPQH